MTAALLDPNQKSCSSIPNNLVWICRQPAWAMLSQERQASRVSDTIPAEEPMGYLHIGVSSQGFLQVKTILPIYHNTMLISSPLRRQA